MHGSNKVALFSVAERCKNILASNCQAFLHTVKADAKGSKDEIHSSKVKCLIKKGKPYIWIPEKDLHNVNTIIDERGSLSVCSPIPGPLRGLLRSLNMAPARVAFSGDVTRLADEKLQSAEKILEEAISTEYKTVRKASYSVSSLLKSAGIGCRSISENLQEVLDEIEKYAVYRFLVRSCSYIDSNNGIHEVEPDDIHVSEADVLAPLSQKLIDGINQNEARRRALMLLCLVHFNINARDALMLAVDAKGFNVLAKVPQPAVTDGDNKNQWKEFRFTFKEEVPNVEIFCSLLVDMEEEALKYVKSFSGIS